MSYYWFNRKEILQKAKKKRYYKAKADEYYPHHKEAIKENSGKLIQKLVKRRKRQD